MAVEHASPLVHARGDRAEDDRPDRDRLDEVPVSDVEVEDAAAGVEQHVDLLAEAREVGRVERRLDLDVPSPRVPRHRTGSYGVAHCPTEPCPGSDPVMATADMSGVRPLPGPF